MNGSTIGLFIEKFNYDFKCKDILDFDWVCNHVR